MIALAKAKPGELNYAAGTIGAAPEVKERLFAGGIQVVASTPEAFAAFIRSDVERIGKLIKTAGIKDE